MAYVSSFRDGYRRAGIETARLSQTSADGYNRVAVHAGKTGQSCSGRRSFGGEVSQRTYETANGK